MKSMPGIVALPLQVVQNHHAEMNARMMHNAFDCQKAETQPRFQVVPFRAGASENEKRSGQQQKPHVHTLFNMLNLYRFSTNTTIRLISGQKWDKLRVHLSSQEGLSAAFTFNHKGLRTLHIACRYNPPLDVIQTLVEKASCSLNVQDSMGQTPLHVAALRQATFPVIEYLLQHNPKAASSFDANGRTPLVLSLLLDKQDRCLTTDREIINALCNAAESSILVEDSSGMSALEYAITGNADASIMRLLMRKTKKERIRHDHARRKRDISSNLNDLPIQAQQQQAPNAA